VYDGDSPSPFRTVWVDVAAAAQEALDQARTDPVGARGFLALVTMGSRSREVHEREIAFLQRHGVPAGFLPDADELDRLFPVAIPEGAGQPVTAAGRR
jgi:hypothetical protein